MAAPGARARGAGPTPTEGDPKKRAPGQPERDPSGEIDLPERGDPEADIPTEPEIEIPEPSGEPESPAPVEPFPP